MKDRHLLGFEEAVRTLLEPVLNRHGFLREEESPGVVRFESPRVSVALLHQPVSYELDLVVIRKDWPDQRFSLQDVVEAAQGAEPTFFQASSADRVSQCVTSIARLLEKYGVGVLRGDVDAFDRMAKAHEHRSRELTNEVVSKPIREAAEIAWKNKDYGQVKRLYESVRGDLTATEVRRLNFAAAHLGNGNQPE
jgi:hypothetical protein